MAKVTILGESPQVKNLLKMIEKVGATKTNILIIGESGTGKELVARAIHDVSPLKGRPFVPVNCGAIPENLIESEMFGHKKGSFTGAVADKTGLFQVADGGTLFLDEVGELPLQMQVKMLRALQERIIRKVGGTDDIRVDVRIISATNQDLEANCAKGTFREDLYYRLNVILIRTPPLRDREGDIPILVNHFIEKMGKKSGIRMEGIEADALVALENYHWPGNVRELENVIERAVALENGKRISFASLPNAIVEAAVRETSAVAAGAEYSSGGGSVTTFPKPEVLTGGGEAGDRLEIRLPAPDFSKGPLDLENILGEVERTYLLKALDHAGGVKKKAAELLGITFRSIRYRLKKLGVD